VVRIGDRELAVDLTASPGAVRPWQEPAHANSPAGKLCRIDSGALWPTYTHALP
jgi:hypothetical protein